MITALLLAFQLAIQAAATPVPVVIETPEGARQPQLAVSSIGKYRGVLVVFGTKNSIQVARSASDGRTFGKPTLVGEVGSLSLGLRRGPRVGAVRKALIVTAIAGEKGGGQDGDLLCWRSETDGKTWKEPARINSVAGSAREGLHALATGPGWNLFTAWIDLETGAPRILGSLTTDAGFTWSKPIVLEGDAKVICPCCSPSAAFGPDGSVAVMWRNQAGGARDMVVARSSDGGKTFAASVRLGASSWKIDACPMDGGAMDSRGGAIAAVWRTDTKVYRGEIGGTESLLGEGQQPWIAATPAGSFVVWVKQRGGALELLRPRATDPLELDAAASDPVVLFAPDESGLAFAAWESGDPAHPKIVVARVDAGGVNTR